MVQLEHLQIAANNTAVAMNARGPLPVDRLPDIPIPASEIALHGDRRGTTIALAAA